MADLYSILTSGSQIDTMVAQYRSSLQSQQAGRLENTKINLTARGTVISALQTKLKTLLATVKNFSGTGASSLFRAFSAVSSQTGVLTATSSSSASVGSHAVQVSQLAKADAMVSARFTSAGTTVSTAELTAGEQTAGEGTRSFRILENGVVKSTVSVTITAGESSSSVMSKVAAAINESTDGSAVMSASVVSISSTESKLVVNSKATGASHSISLEDVSGTMLDNLGWGDAVVSGRSAPTAIETVDSPSTSPGGYLYGATALLDSVFTVDGISVRRETNAVSDVLSGVTLDLKSAQLSSDTAVNVAVGVDRTLIKTRVEAFMTDFNAAMDYLTQKTSYDTVTATRAILAGDSTFSGIRSGLKSNIFSVVSGVTTGNPTLLADVGITLDKYGKLSISSTTKFEDALKFDATKFEQLFTASDGIAVRMNTYLEGIVGTSGSVLTRNESITAQLKNVNAQITRVTERVNKQVEKFRSDFVKAQAAVAAATQQQAMITSLMSSYFAA